MPDGIDFKKTALLSVYGLSMIWSPVFGTTEAAVFSALSASPDALLVSRALNLGAFALTMLLLSFAGDSAKRLLPHAWLTGAVMVLGAFGMLAGSLAGMLVAPLWLLFPAAVARGVFAGFATVMWTDALVHLKGNSIGIAVSAALALYAAVGLAIAGIALTLPTAAALLLTACAPLSYLGSIRARSAVSTEQPVDQESSAVPGRSRALLDAANLAFGIMLGALLCHFAFHDTLASIAVFFLAAVILMALFASSAGRKGPHSIYRSLTMAIAIIMSALVLAGEFGSVIAEAAASGVLVVVLLYTVIIFVDTQARLRKPYWKIPGETQFFAAVGMIVSCAVVRLTYPNGYIPGAHLLLLALACTVFIVCVFSPNVRSQVRPWGFSSLVPEESPETKAMRRCSELADEHKLTSRELEILQQLVVGTTRDDIAAMFFISPATVKTHIRNIYAKLEVHSRKELIALVEEQRA